MSNQDTAFPLVFDAAFVGGPSFVALFEASGTYDPEWTATGETTDVS